MDTITFPATWKRLWGFSGASILALMTEKEEVYGDWFPLLSKDIQSSLSLHPSGINVARERLRADQVIDYRRTGITYQYRIDHQRLSELEQEGDK